MERCLAALQSLIDPGTPDAEAETRDAPEAEPERIARGRAYALHPTIRLVWLAHRLTFWGIAGTVFFALLRFAEGFAASRFPALVLATPLPLVVIAAHVLYPFLAYRYWSYELREHDFVVRHGVFNRRAVAITLARIQQVDSRSGPLGRLLGNAEIVIHTAGTRVARTVLSGVPIPQAELLRDQLSRLGDAHADD